MLRAPGEADDAYRARLLNTFEIWATAGTEAGLLELFRVAGATNVTITEDQDVGGALGHWARFSISVAEPHPFTAPALWDGFDYDDGTLWGFADGAALEYTQLVVRRWKPAHTRCVGIGVQWASVPGETVIFPIEDGVPAFVAPSHAIFTPDLSAIVTPDGMAFTDGTED